jgi:hypothetical protein
MSILTLPTVGSISPEGSSIHHIGRDAGTTRSLISLAAAGFVTVEGNRVVLTPKGKKAKKRSDKAELREAHKECVLKALANAPKDSRGLSFTKPVHFRAAVEASKAGVTTITRADVLDSLRDLREEGKVESVRTSQSNFGVRWKVSPQAAV